MEAQAGSVMFLKHAIAGLPYPTGFWVVCEVAEARIWMALLGTSGGKLASIRNWYEISVEDLYAFELTDETAIVRGTRADSA